MANHLLLSACRPDQTVGNVQLGQHGGFVASCGLSTNLKHFRFVDQKRTAMLQRSTGREFWFQTSV